MSGAIDLDEGLRHCFGRRTLFDRLAAQFLATQHDMPRRLAQALEQGDAAAAADETHRMVSNAGTLGAVRLARLSVDLDALLRETRTADALALLPALLAAHAEACAALQQLLGHGGQDTHLGVGR